MTDTNQLPPHTITIHDHPEPHIMQWSDLELAAVKRYAEQYALQARAQVQGEPVYQCRHADGSWGDQTRAIYDYDVELGATNVRVLYTAPQPAPASQAEVADADIEQVLALAHSYADAKLMRYGALGIKEPPDPAAAFIELRRAILALRPERVPMIARSLAEWHEDDGYAVWWAWNGDLRGWAGEPAYIGSPLCDDWPGYHTHWTAHPTQPIGITAQAKKEAS
mgnify:CR=1 FL=1